MNMHVSPASTRATADIAPDTTAHHHGTGLDRRLLGAFDPIEARRAAARLIAPGHWRSRPSETASPPGGGLHPSWGTAL